MPLPPGLSQTIVALIEPVMEMGVSEAAERHALLLDEVRRELRYYYRIGRWAYRSAFALRAGIILSSIAAGAVGLLALKPQLAGGIALLPGALTLFSTRMKLQDRANIHYERAEALDALRSTLLYCLPNPPTLKQISQIALRKQALGDQMSKRWEQSFGSDTDLVNDPPHLAKNQRRCPPTILGQLANPGNPPSRSPHTVRRS